MINYVQLEPDGLFVYKWQDKQEVRFRAKKKIAATYLRCACKIKEGTTLKDIFRTVDNYKLLKIFISQYSWCGCIDEFHAQAEELMRTEDKIPLDYLEIYWCPEIHEYNEKVNKEKIRVVNFDANTGFHGIGDQEPNAKYKTENGKENYSVSYSPMYDLADVPVKLNEEFIVEQPWKKGVKEREVLIKSTRTFSLLEVLDSIYDDISFHGGPQENAKFLEEMRVMVEEIKNDDLNDRKKYISVDEMMKDLGLEDEDDG